MPGRQSDCWSFDQRLEVRTLGGWERQEVFTFQRTGIGGKDQRRMIQALWNKQVALGVRHGVLTLTTSWTGSAEPVEGFVEGAAPGKLAEAVTEVGKSKIRKGRWVAQQAACPSKVDDRYRQIVAVLDRGLVDAPSSRESPSQPDGTVAR